MSALTASDIILRPVISEKSIDVSTIADRNPGAGNKYTFAVHRDANKIQIKDAIQTLFKVGVVDVNTLVMRGKDKRMGRGYAKLRNWKKAIVTLKPEQKIELFEQV